MSVSEAEVEAAAKAIHDRLPFSWKDAWEQSAVVRKEDCAALARVALAAVASARWQPIEEAPKDGRWLIAVCNDRDTLKRISWGTDREGRQCWCSTIGSFGDGLFAGWIEFPPIPSPPETER